MRWKGLGNFSESQHSGNQAIVWLLAQKIPRSWISEAEGVNGIHQRQSFPPRQYDSSYILTYEDESPGTAS